MIERLKPYPEYKDSGLLWLGRVPGHWTTAPGFAAFREKEVKNTGLQEKRVLSLSYGRIVIKPLEKLHGLVPDSFETYQIVNPGDIIIRSTDLQNDKTSLRIGMVRDRGVITSAYICLKTTEAVLPDLVINCSTPMTCARCSTAWGLAFARIWSGRISSGCRYSFHPTTNKPPSSASSTTPPGGWTRRFAPSARPSRC